MTIEIRIYLAEQSGLDLLSRWLDDVPDVTTRPIARSPQPGEQGGAWDFLSVLCGTGGAVTVALNALTTWIESKSVTAKVKLGDVEVELRGSDAEKLARLADAAGKVAHGRS